MSDGARRDEIAVGLDGVHARIATACAEAGRDPGDVELIVVTKFFPVTDIRLLADLGVRDVGENRDQEAREKLTDPLLDGTGLTRHFIGQLQSNKAASVVSYADVVHTADRSKVVAALGRAADHQGRTPPRPRPGQPRRRTGPRRRRRRRRPGPGRRHRRSTRPRARRRHGGGPAGGRPGRGVRPAVGGGDPHTAGSSAGHLGVGGHERGPRGRHPARSDTPACRERNPGIASDASLTSLGTTVDRCFIALPREFHDGWGASQDDGVPRACRGRRPLRRRRAPRRRRGLRRRRVAAPRSAPSVRPSGPRPARPSPSCPAARHPWRGWSASRRWVR